ncbi:MAG: ThuA domain-containing protein [Alkalibacterium sp.]|nr:ThuA domain-containing protein [Alkalibacterium sp.]
MRIVAVLGDYYHNEIHLQEALSNVSVKLNDAEVIYTTRKNLIDELKKQPDLVVLSTENRIDPEADNPTTWMTDSEETAIIDYVGKGGAWLAWHSGLASYENNPSYTDMVGGYFTHHPDKHVNVHYLYEESEALSHRKEEFVILDEHYFIEYNADVSVFLKSSSEHGASVAGWTKLYGKGKVCAYIPAHNRDGLMDESLQTDLKEIINWLTA